MKLLQCLPENNLTKLSEKAQVLIARQRRRYIESMPAKRDVILQCITQIHQQAKSREPELCEKLFQQIHRLAGSAGSYGFGDLGQAASVVDRYLIARSLEPGDLPELESMLQKLIDEINKIIAQHG